ncbi:MAG: hypothetical protein EOM54_13690 [Clostridia bacterium]|nr:hypothetical protein [Clostridia bacterium]
MFHVMLVLPYLFAFGFVLLIPYWIGGGLQLLLTIFCNRKRFLLIPAILGLLGFGASLWFFREGTPLGAFLLYWGFYFLSLLIVWAIVRTIKRAVARQIDKRVEEQVNKE